MEKAEGSVLYLYGMRLRGYAPMCQPRDGLVGRRDDTTGRYHDQLVYNRRLTAQELSNYELDELGEIEKES